MQTLKLSQACDDNDPKSIWNFLNSSRRVLQLNISARDWFNYFSKVYVSEDNDTPKDDEILK